MSIDKTEGQTTTTNSNQLNRFSDEDLCRIKDFQIGELPKNSAFVRPYRATFIDEGNKNPVKRIWDGIDSHVDPSFICSYPVYSFSSFLGFRCDYCL